MTSTRNTGHNGRLASLTCRISAHCIDQSYEGSSANRLSAFSTSIAQCDGNEAILSQRVYWLSAEPA